MAKCPNCKEPVSQFAAGCAICGTDLEAHRRAVAQRRASRRLPTMPQLSEDTLVVGLIALVAFAFPLAGIVLAALALTRHPVLSFPGAGRNSLFVVIGFALVLLVTSGGPGGLFVG